MADIKDILVPDIGDFEGVEVIEILVAAGDSIAEEEPIVSLESDKAAMEIPSPFAGTVKEIKVTMGDKVSEGDLLITMEASDATASSEALDEKTGTETSKETSTQTESTPPAPAPTTQAQQPQTQKTARRPSPTASVKVDEEGFRKAHASPSVRKFARELGADLAQILSLIHI